MGAWKQAMVCGLGASGVAAARLLRAEGVSVLAVDERDAPEGRKNAAELSALGCAVALGAPRPPEGDFDVAVASPGLPAAAPFLSGIRRRGIPLVAEMELGWSRFRGRTVAVTGSNGKSSVVKALAECLAAGGLRATPCGNYGLPVCQAVRDAPGADWLVIEVSSFQLETCAEFRPDIGVLMNVLPNHLDRHGDMETYARLKARLFARQRGGDVALTPPEWNARLRRWSGGRGQWKTFGAEPAADFVFAGGRLAEKGAGAIGLDGSYFNNAVLGANAAALFGAARAAGLAPETAQEVLRRFEPLPHRAQVAGEFNGVRYVDDSKATNLSAMIASIRMQDRPVWLIAGGRPKEADFSAAIPVLKARVRGVFLIGEAAPAMAAAWGGAVPCEGCGTLDRAVAAARRAARPGEAVLLAPACTSYDQFRAYAERGEAFRKFASEKD
ncbi:MAG: UDP-N-acetylmuramoyl-L-alanine--D-glutamate ligase [Opitutae bacterium]|nr:UDP-N-acetylmuramoyl-L-alanine--D-glutamate ligase [Opitutae bacterium]